MDDLFVTTRNIDGRFADIDSLDFVVRQSRLPCPIFSDRLLDGYGRIVGYSRIEDSRSPICLFPRTRRDVAARLASERNRRCVSRVSDKRRDRFARESAYGSIGASMRLHFPLAIP